MLVKQLLLVVMMTYGSEGQVTLYYSENGMILENKF
jgi:hypothetical protein